MNAGRLDDVTPAELRELAARVHELAVCIDAVQARLRAAGDESTRRVGFRLPDAAGWVRSSGRDLEATAADLDRIRGRRGCGAAWGICPEHGATLRSTGGRSWCSKSRCGREWDHDRAGLPCTEPAAYEVRDAAGAGGLMCAGHAAVARRQLVGARVTVLPAEDGRR